MSHTYAVLQISRAAFDEIRSKFKDAGYEHAFDDAAEGGPVVNMHGVAVQALHEDPTQDRKQPRLEKTAVDGLEKMFGRFLVDDTKWLSRWIDKYGKDLIAQLRREP